MIPFTRWISLMMQARKRAQALTRAREALNAPQVAIDEPHLVAERLIETLRRRIDPNTIPAAFVLAWGLTVAEKEARP